jgi:hypothetical protein
MGGGGYFRMFPLLLTEWAMKQSSRIGSPPVAMLYFHPWEFDSEQKRLPIGRWSSFRTYVGICRTRDRLSSLLARYRFSRAVAVVKELNAHRQELSIFGLVPSSDSIPASAGGAVE